MSGRITRRDFLKAGVSLAAGAAAASAAARFAMAVAATQTAPDTRPAALPQRPLGKTGLEVSILGLGGEGVLSDSADADQAERFLNEAVDSGINFFDTAYSYGQDGRCDRNLGLLMGGPRRKKVFLAAKVEDRTYDGAMRQAEESLKRLRTDRVDLMQVHYVNPRDDVKGLGRPGGVLAALRKLREQGVARFLGMTGHPDFPQVAEAMEAYADEWDTFMCYVNPTRFCKPVRETQLPIARRRNIGVIGMKVFGGKPGGLIGTGAGKAPAETLLRYAWDQPIALTLAGMSSREELRRNVESARRYKPLIPAEREALVARFEVR